ncbi:MAG: transglycosylase SLT domain-containing protein [Cyanobium sp.]
MGARPNTPSAAGAGLLLLLAWLGPGCTPALSVRGGASGSPVVPSSGASPTPAAGTVVLPLDPSRPASGDGLRYPLVPSDPAQLASLLAAVEAALRASGTPAAQLPALGHQQQVIYRVLGFHPVLAARVRARLPQRWWRVFDLQVAARRAFISMHPSGRRPRQVPAWRIQRPEPLENLLRHYREASAATGIPWQVLAAVNLVESGMGRIDGVSVADAHGPMQFLPSTWAEPGIGNGGDIRDPRSAIHAAARYLVRRGGLRDIRRGLWGYNNSDAYGTGVLLYAQLLREDPAAYTGLYHWQIHYAAAGGDLWLPPGYDQPRPLAVGEFLKRSPVSQPPPGSSGY